jgi:hypothetical protein
MAAGFGLQGGEVLQFAGVLVDAHQRRQLARFTRVEAGPLLGRGTGRQAGAGKHQQQALRLGLLPRGGQQVVEVLDVHGRQLIRLQRPAEHHG